MWTFNVSVLWPSLYCCRWICVKASLYCVFCHLGKFHCYCGILTAFIFTPAPASSGVLFLSASIRVCVYVSVSTVTEKLVFVGDLYELWMHSTVLRDLLISGNYFEWFLSPQVVIMQGSVELQGGLLPDLLTRGSPVIGSCSVLTIWPQKSGPESVTENSRE